MWHARPRCADSGSALRGRCARRRWRRYGCGTGDLLAPFEKRGLAVLGIDGSKVSQKYSAIRNLVVFDLRKKYEPESKYDLCICLEVAEHIEQRYSNVLVGNLISSSPDNIIFSAAPPGQGGRDHANLKPYEWWIQKFNKHGFEFREQLTERFKREMKKFPSIQRYYVDNLLIFGKGQKQSGENLQQIE